MTSKKVEGVFENNACELLKLVSGSKPGYAAWNAEKSHSVTFGFIAAYANEKINILLSVLSIFFSMNLI